MDVGKLVNDADVEREQRHRTQAHIPLSNHKTLT